MVCEIEFTTTVMIDGSKSYINDCCWGGDVICDRLLSDASVWEIYGSVRTGQEDWGWYIWMRQGRRVHRIHVQCDDKAVPEFRIHVFSTERRWFRIKNVDTVETHAIKEAVIAEVAKWGTVHSVKSLPLDAITT